MRPFIATYDVSFATPALANAFSVAEFEREDLFNTIVITRRMMIEGREDLFGVTEGTLSVMRVAKTSPTHRSVVVRHAMRLDPATGAALEMNESDRVRAYLTEVLDIPQEEREYWAIEKVTVRAG